MTPTLTFSQKGLHVLEGERIFSTVRSWEFNILTYNFSEVKFICNMCICVEDTVSCYMRIECRRAKFGGAFVCVHFIPCRLRKKIETTEYKKYQRERNYLLLMS